MFAMKAPARAKKNKAFEGGGFEVLPCVVYHELVVLNHGVRRKHYGAKANDHVINLSCTIYYS